MSEDQKTPQAVDASRLNELLQATKQKIRLQDRIEALERDVFDAHMENARAKKQHKRELDIAIQAKGGAAVVGEGKPFAAAVVEYLGAQRKPTTRRTYKGHLAHAQAFFGEDKDIRLIEQAELAAYSRHALKDIPNSTTAGFHITTLCGMLNLFRSQEGWGPELRTKKLVQKKDTPDSNDRDAFTLDQLAVVIQSAAKFRSKEPHKYWVTVAAAFLGCRVEELAQINLLTDLHQDDATGIWYFDLNGTADPDGVVRKSMKNKASWRCLPIHSSLVEHGFVDYLQAQVRAGYSRPFESGIGALVGRDDGSMKWSHYITNWGGRELKKLRASGAISDPNNKLAYFHSMRHTFSITMRRAGVSPEIVEAALGHAYAGSERERYDKLKYDPVQLSREGVEAGLNCLVSVLFKNGW